MENKFKFIQKSELLKALAHPTSYKTVHCKGSYGKRE
jgi:hypothetical protein